MLAYFRTHYYTPDTTELTAVFGVTHVSIWAWLKLLEAQDLIIRANNKHLETVRLTREGLTYQDRARTQEKPIPLHPCGHPIAASTPNYCLKCHQERHRKALGYRVRYSASKQAQLAP